MYILTNKANVIICISKKLDHQENGNPLVEDINGNEYAIASILVDKEYKVDNVPEEIKEDKYCYTEEKGFYLNENYIEPKPEITNEEIMQEITDIQLALAEIVEGGM